MPKLSILHFPANLIVFGLVLVTTPIILALHPAWDIAVSAVFYQEGSGFPAARHMLWIGLHNLALYGGWGLGILLLLGTLISYARRQSFLMLRPAAWLFLLLALLLGPGLIANIVFKDHWGRARPNAIHEFAGNANFSPAFVPSNQCDHNCSFIAGDPSFGFALTSLAYVVAPARRRRFFWLGMGAGLILGLDRLVMGAHFLSDIAAAALFMLISGAVLHTILEGWQTTRSCWMEFFGIKHLNRG